MSANSNNFYLKNKYIGWLKKDYEKKTREKNVRTIGFKETAATGLNK